jgi:serine O-acetyltransferase
MDQSFLKKIFHSHQACPSCPSPQEVSSFFSDLLGILFPEHATKKFHDKAEFQSQFDAIRIQCERIIRHTPGKAQQESVRIADEFFEFLPSLYDLIEEDVNAMFQGDPAAKSRSEVVRTYPGFHAIAAYRIANTLHRLGVAEVPRMITEYAHSKTGIDIHPGATIGKSFCIDHGTGVVIGETTVIGDFVKIYQGVTLGALSVSKEDAEKKRHPTLQDHVVVYAGATILGGATTIGHHSIIGGNVWLTKSIPPHSKMYYQSRMFNDRTGETDVVILKSGNSLNQKI